MCEEEGGGAFSSVSVPTKETGPKNVGFASVRFGVVGAALVARVALEVGAVRCEAVDERLERRRARGVARGRVGARAQELLDLAREEGGGGGAA